MSGKVKACSACQRNGRLTCRRCSDKRVCALTDCAYLPCDVKTSVLLQDQAGGPLSEDVSAGKRGSPEEG